MDAGQRDEALRRLARRGVLLRHPTWALMQLEAVLTEPEAAVATTMKKSVRVGDVTLDECTSRENVLLVVKEKDYWAGGLNRIITRQQAVDLYAALHEFLS